MLFSRRKRATAVEPAAPEAIAHSNGAEPDAAPDEIPTDETPAVELPPVFTDPLDPLPAVELPPVFTDPLEPLPTVVTSTTGAPIVPVAAPEATSSVADPPDEPSGMPLAPGDETGDADLDRFFAALRQVVHDARERLPVEADQPDEADPTAPYAREARDLHRDDDDERVSTTATVVSAQLDQFTTTELAPTTAELVTSLEADRDLWRERAIVWRERAMGADMLVKTLNAHMSDLQINLEDLRMAMRVLSANTSLPPEPRAALSAQTPRRSGLDRFLDPGE